MADQLQLRGGTTSENLVFTGAQREVTVDTDKHTIVVHDGITNGGFPLASEGALNSFTIFFDDDAGGGSVADAYQLSAKDNSILPNQYNDGQYYGFITTNPNTGPATADFINLGQKNIKYADGSDPEAGDIDGRVTMIYDESNDWFELQRKFRAADTPPGLSQVRQTVLAGPVDANGQADFIIAGTGLQAIASGLSASPLLISFGNGYSFEQGSSDVLVEVDSNQIFGGLVDNDTNYLYLDYDQDAQTITPGSTTRAPTYAYKKPTAPASGDYWYPVDHRSRGESFNGAWSSVLRVYVGHAVTAGGSVTSAVTYAYQGLHVDVSGSALPVTGTYTITHNIGAPAVIESLTGEMNQNEGAPFLTGTLLYLDCAMPRNTTSTSDGGYYTYSDDEAIQVTVKVNDAFRTDDGDVPWDSISVHRFVVRRFF
jgi:hypothetical protein